MSLIVLKSKGLKAAFLACALLILSAAPAAAHEEAAVGAMAPVTAVSSSSITVGGKVFQIGPGTTITDVAGNRVDISAVSVGNLASVTADGTTAKTIRVHNVRPPD